MKSLRRSRVMDKYKYGYWSCLAIFQPYDRPKNIVITSWQVRPIVILHICTLRLKCYVTVILPYSKLYSLYIAKTRLCVGGMSSNNVIHCGKYSKGTSDITKCTVQCHYYTCRSRSVMVGKLPLRRKATTHTTYLLVENV